MPHRLHTALLILSAVATLVFATASTSANRLSVSSSTFRVVYTPIEFAEQSAGISCNITLEGSLHSGTIAKIEGSLSGSITRVSIQHETCREPIGLFAANAWYYNGETILGVATRNGLPWHLTYKGFTGNLPNINQVLVLTHGIRFAVQIAAKSCLGIYGGSEANLIDDLTLGSNGEVVSIEPEANASLPLAEGTSGCPNPAFFRGTGTVTQAGSSTRITVRLI